MQKRSRSQAWLVILVLMLSTLGTPALCLAQQNEALRDRVLQLVSQLDDPDRADQATESLQRLGARILPYLPEAESVDDREIRRQLVELRQRLQDQLKADRSQGTRVTLQGQGIRLSDAIANLQRQSGNPLLDLREQFGEVVDNPTLDLNLENVTFFEALDAITEKANLEPYYFTEDGSIGLISSSAMAMEAPGQPGSYGQSTASGRVQYVGPFRVDLRALTIRRAFNEQTAAANAEISVAWEPKLRPMLMNLQTDAKIVDDQERTIVSTLGENATEVILRPESPMIEVNYNFSAPPRDAQLLKTLTFQAKVTIPGELKRFTFSDFSAVRDEQTDGPVTVTLLSSRIDDFAWRFNVAIAYKDGGPALETYQQGLFNNRLWLQRPDGSRFDLNGGFNTLGSNDGSIAYQYIFVDVPGDPDRYRLVVETPSTVEEIDLEATFTDVQLP